MSRDVADSLTRDTIPASTAEPSGSAATRGAVLSAISVAILGLLLLTATWFEGAFAVRHWAPVAILSLVTVAAAIAGGLRLRGDAAGVAGVAIWLYAGWSALSALWAESPARALEGGAVALLYAALFTIAVAAPSDARVAGRLGRAAVAGIALVAAITLVELTGDGTAEFLAGRLDAPVGYRNATACLFAIAFWPLVATAAHRTALAPLRALAFAAAVLVLGLAVLTEARGVLLGLVAGGVVAIGLGPSRLRRAWVALIAVGLLALISDDLLTPYRAFSDGEPETAADIAVAVDALTLAVLGAAAVGLVGAVLDGGLRLSTETRLAARRAGAAVLGLFAAGALVVVLAAVGNPVTFAGDRFDEFRGLEATAPGETRLSFGGGQRSDIWRVALVEFSERPIAGVGESNYPFGYYEERRNDRNLSTPHSLVLGTLAEKGLVGLILLLGFLGAVAAAVAARWRRASAEARWVCSGLVAGAAVAFAQSSVDWIWHVPGVMGLAFLLLGLGVAALRPERGEATSRPWRGGSWAIAAVAAVSAVGVTLLYLSDAEVDRARADDAGAAERLGSARAAERLNRWSVTPRYLQAAALEDLGSVAVARRELLGALELEPANFVTYALLGDLDMRRGDRRAARGWYRQALERNPLDAGLRDLVRRAGGR